MSIALLIVGEMRFENEYSLNIFIDKFKKYDIYISTYLKYKNIASKISKNTIFLENYNNEKQKKSNIYQWLHLDYIISNYKKKLLNYDKIFKIRTDIIFENDIFDYEISNNTIYLYRDFLFFGKSKYFIDVFKYYYNDIVNKYYGCMNAYHPLKYENMLSIKYPSFNWKWLVLPKIIYNKKFNIMKENIIKHKKLLNDNFNNIEEFDETKFIKNFNLGLFSSEKTLLINCLNKGKIDGIKFKVNLIKDRKNFNFY